jgi:hypothetical protein
VVNKEIKKYLSTVKRLFNTPDGIEVLKYWKEAYFDETALVRGDTNATMCALGKKELIQEFMSHVKEQEALYERIKIETDDMENL